GDADADAGERPRADVAGDGVEGLAALAGLLEDSVERGEDALGMALEVGVDGGGDERAVPDEGGAAAGRRCGERDEVHEGAPGTLRPGGCPEHPEEHGMEPVVTSKTGMRKALLLSLVVH